VAEFVNGNITNNKVFKIKQVNRQARRDDSREVNHPARNGWITSLTSAISAIIKARKMIWAYLVAQGILIRIY
jgi:hypothetical protein